MSCLRFSSFFFYVKTYVYSLQGYSASSCTEKSGNTVTYMAAHQICYVVSLDTVNGDMPGGVHEGV